MLRISTSFILCLLLTASIGAADSGGPNRPSLAFFPHNLHQKNLKGCSECHGAKGPGPITQFGEEWAHTTCKGCHSKKHIGPVECNGCHTQF
jgi:hypothetical protein